MILLIEDDLEREEKERWYFDKEKIDEFIDNFLKDDSNHFIFKFIKADCIYEESERKQLERKGILYNSTEFRGFLQAIKSKICLIDNGCSSLDGWANYPSMSEELNHALDLLTNFSIPRGSLNEPTTIKHYDFLMSCVAKNTENGKLLFEYVPPVYLASSMLRATFDLFHKKKKNFKMIDLNIVIERKRLHFLKRGVIDPQYTVTLEILSSLLEDFHECFPDDYLNIVIEDIITAYPYQKEMAVLLVVLARHIMRDGPASDRVKVIFSGTKILEQNSIWAHFLDMTSAEEYMGGAIRSFVEKDILALIWNEEEEKFKRH